MSSDSSAVVYKARKEFVEDILVLRLYYSFLPSDMFKIQNITFLRFKIKTLKLRNNKNDLYHMKGCAVSFMWSHIFILIPTDSKVSCIMIILHYYITVILKLF